MTVNSINYNVKLGTVIRKDGDRWTAWCVPLEEKAYGGTEEEALEALKGAVDLWFATLPHGEGILNKARRQQEWAEHLRWKQQAEYLRRQHHAHYRRRRPPWPGPLRGTA